MIPRLPTRPIRPLLIILLIMLPALMLAACGAADQRDRAQGLNRDDYRALAGRPSATPPPDQGPVDQGPVVQPPPVPDPDDDEAVAVPSAADLALLNRPVTITATDRVPVADLVAELAGQAGIDVVIDPALDGAARVSLDRAPLGRALAAIGRQAGFVSRIEDGVLVVERDRPVVRTYRIEQPDMVRSVQGAVAASSELDTVGAGGGGNADRNGSSIAIRNHTDGDFWTDLEGSLAAVLGIPALASADVMAADPARPRLTVNRRVGLVAIYGDARAQEAARRVIDGLRRTAARQVLIEARVVEVALNEGYEAGINWSAVLSGDVVLGGRFGAPAARIANGVDDVFSVGINGSDIDALIGLVARFGAVRTLSSPRMTVLNNQTALLKVAENAVYFTLDVERETDDETGDTRLTVNSRLNTVPIGLVLAVQPVVSSNGSTVVMTVRPTITRVAREVPDPGVAVVSQNQVESLVPVVEVRELDSVLRMQSGEIMIMGGLMEERARLDESGAPVLKDLPWLGRLFRADSDQTRTVELVVFLRATILAAPGAGQGSGTVAPADIDLYRGFTTDPRPLPFPSPRDRPAVPPLPPAPTSNILPPIPIPDESEPQR